MASQAIIQIPGPFAFSSVRQMVPLSQGSVYLFQGDSDVLQAAMQEFIDRLGMRGAVQVVVGGNRISFDHLPLILGDQIGRVYEIMDRILVSRAETCYQMQDVLAALEPSPIPIVITDMLESFYEEDLTPQEVTLLLQKCIRHIHKLSEAAPVLISACGDPSRPKLLELIEQNSDERFYFQPFDHADDLVQVNLPGI
ncbi:MAG: hypothetical protein M1347_02280 [Chloroflexi bacterium]|nr:hypothetical protein [Chloroflexota bacterium]